MAYDIGGGGGRSQTDIVSDRIAFAKPHDIYGEWSSDVAQKLNEMLDDLYNIANRTDDVGVKGPSSAVDGNIAIFDGPTGKIIKDGGTAAHLLIASKPLTEAEIEALNTTPIEIIAAPGNGRIIVPVHCLVKVVLTTTYSTNPNFNLNHNGNTANNLLNGVTLGLTTDTGTKYRTADGTNWTHASTFDPINKSVKARLDANPGTPGTGVVTATVVVAYWVTPNLG